MEQFEQLNSQILFDFYLDFTFVFITAEQSNFHIIEINRFKRTFNFYPNLR